ncbi:MAG: phenylacetate--CoA ligase family protein, partial [Methanomicrobiales archaeon]|nr:phenylacetate--CoA ligase family protein [Methanomicrobiales archaeon]
MIRLGERICGRESFTAKALGILPSYSTYRKTYALLQESRWWNREELLAYQTEALSHLLDHAY